MSGLLKQAYGALAEVPDLVGTGRTEPTSAELDDLAGAVLPVFS